MYLTARGIVVWTMFPSDHETEMASGTALFLGLLEYCSSDHEVPLTVFSANVPMLGSEGDGKMDGWIHFIIIQVTW